VIALSHVAPTPAESLIHRDRVVRDTAALRRLGHAITDFDGLEPLECSSRRRRGDRRVFAVPVHVATEAHRHAVGNHLDDAAERVASGRGLDLAIMAASLAASKTAYSLSSTRSSHRGVVARPWAPSPHRCARRD